MDSVKQGIFDFAKKMGRPPSFHGVFDEVIDCPVLSGPGGLVEHQKKLLSKYEGLRDEYGNVAMACEIIDWRSSGRFRRKAEEYARSAELARLKLEEYLEAQIDCGGNDIAEKEYVKSTRLKYGPQPGRMSHAGSPMRKTMSDVKDKTHEDAARRARARARARESMRARKKKLSARNFTYEIPHLDLSTKEAFLIIEHFAVKCDFDVKLLNDEIKTTHESAKRRPLQDERDLLEGHLKALGLRPRAPNAKPRLKPQPPCWVAGALIELYAKHLGPFRATELNERLVGCGLDPWHGDIPEAVRGFKVRLVDDMIVMERG